MTVPGPTTAPPAAPPHRPDSVRYAVQLWIGVIVAQIVATIARWDLIKTNYSKQLTQFAKEHDEPSLIESLDSTFLIGMVIVLAVLSALAALLCWFTYRGYTWARLLLGWISAFITVQLVMAIVGLFTDSPTSGDLPPEPVWAMIPTIIGGVCAVGALAALMHRDSATFCREAAAFRRGNRHNGI